MALLTGQIAPTVHRADGVSRGHPSTGPARAVRPPPVVVSTMPVVSTTTTTDPGSLPQTNEFPSTATPQFQVEMSALWQAVVTGSAGTAHPAYFPESAYVQLKRIAAPQSDYIDRLLTEFDADVLAAHAVLGVGAPDAQLIGVDVPAQYGHWIPAGVCDNGVGYYEVANSRVVYRKDGQTRSFGIASLISWRGVWYVVHLGAILRSSGQGVVEDPEVGPGSSADSSTC